jgi:lipid A 3-O-deacylase
MWFFRVIFLVLVICANIPVRADDARPQLASIYWENDLFLRTDESYTNGLRVSWARLLKKDSVWWLPDRFLRKSFERCTGDNTNCFEWWTGFVMGQSMYTPDNISEASVIRTDRPYAGWCYGGPTYSAIRKSTDTQKASQHSFEFLLGAVGEPSFAEEAQIFVHKHITTNAADPQGWSHQIASEVTLNIQYSGRRREFELKSRSTHRIFDVTSEWTAAAGNAFIYAGGGGTLRLGWHLGDDFGASRIEPTRTFDSPGTQNWELYGFFRLGGRYVAHNITLDGGWFADSEHTVVKKNLVGHAEIGVALRVKPVLLSFRYVQLSPEFHERSVVQEFGALSLTVLF